MIAGLEADAKQAAGNNNLDTIGEAQPPLVATSGYDDTTGLGAPGSSFRTAFPGL